ncbi:ABC transporter permease YtrF precursor [Pirellula sp. SH-Sr6A]|uniref:ABC transporter permease n=1 Tax=Pirellula sp. SH-Sr6A TaxID=1632865 RepID=UPI00078BBD26|nr:FtsX-like permease family protein [Pirellula sp. SH-Sr6A]AMV32536.1 ABC transporter permease YtrF precursor [Pirellula sp. SH-Sr6A]
MPLGKLSRREIQSRPLRSLLTLLSVVIGVSAIVATSLASNSARLAQEAMVQSVTGKASLEIEGVGGASFDGKPLEFVAKLDAVQVASPILRRFSNMQVVPAKEPGKEAEKSADSSESKKPISYRVQLLGVMPDLDKQVRGYTVVEGKELTYEESDRQSVLIDAGFAQSAKIKVGSQLRLLTRSFGQNATVVGLIKANDASAGLQSGLVVGQLRTIQRWSQANGKLDAVQVVLKPKADAAEVMAAISSQLPEGMKVREPALRSQVAGESTIAMQQGLRLATAFALLISAFIIYNTFQMNVGERRRQLGILRSMGALRGQLLWMIVREGLWLGAIGIVLGCIVGYFGASLLNQSTSKLLQISIPQSPWSIWPYLSAAIAGLVVAFLGAFFPAFRASQLSPAEAMRVVATGEFGSSRIGWLVFGTTMITVGGLTQFLSVSGMIDESHAITGAVVMIVGMIFLLPGIISDLTDWVAKLISPILKTEAQLARRQILRHRGRSSLTIGIVFIAMSTGLGMASTILDNIGNVEGWYQRSIIGDFFIRAAMPDMNSGQSADMPDGLTEQVAAMPGVDVVDTLRFVRARSGENSVVVVVRKFNSTSQDYFDLVEGEEKEVMDGVQKGKVVLGSVLSQRLNLHRGDTIPLETNDGSSDLEIVGVTNEYIAGGLTLYLESDNAKRLLNVEGTDVIVVKSKPEALKSLEARLRSLCDETGLMFQSYADLVKVIRDTLNGVVGGLWAVLILGSIIAAFGLINTLAMNILEQTREIGMLRVVAMTRRQVRRMIFAQALIMGLIGIVPGVLTGVWISYLINLTTMQVTGHDVAFKIYPWLLGGGLLFELLVVIVASWIPAERAARINLSKALQYE